MVLKKLFIFILSALTINVLAQKKTTPTDTTKNIIAIKGTVEKGVEAGCVILRTKGNKTYLLLNLKTTITYGACIKATGYIQKNTASICMQGIPFYVLNYCPCGKKSKPKYQRKKSEN